MSSWPSWKRTPLRSVTTQVVGSGFSSRSASPPSVTYRRPSSILSRPSKISWWIFCDESSRPKRGSRLFGPLVIATTMTFGLALGRSTHAHASAASNDERPLHSSRFLLEPGEQWSAPRAASCDRRRARQARRESGRLAAEPPGRARAAAAARWACRSPTAGRRASARRVRGRRESRAPDRPPGRGRPASRATWMP